MAVGGKEGRKEGTFSFFFCLTPFLMIGLMIENCCKCLDQIIK